MFIKRVIFIRPGETEWDRERRLQGWVQIPMDDVGRLQAQRLAGFVRHFRVGAVYTSDLRRARETAEILATALGQDSITDKRLRERHEGEWQGLTPEQVWAWYPEEYKSLTHNRATYQIPGGESRQQVVQRMRLAFDEIVERGKAETVAVVSHAYAIRHLLHNLIASSAIHGVDLANMSATTIARDDASEDWRLIELNDTSHLQGMVYRSLTDISEF
jgi:broad specificity phosphatase PhoE